MNRILSGLVAVLALSMPAARLGAAEPVLPYTPGLDPEAMDRAVDPCTDFYQYACGGWQQHNPIPPDQSSWDVYRKLADSNLELLRGILEQAAATGSADPVTARIGRHYATCMDEAAVERRGLQPLERDLHDIAALKSTRELAPLLARLQRTSVGRAPLFEAGSQQDPDDAERVIAVFDQGGLGLPERDYYLKDDARSRDNRDKYRAHVARVLVLLGEAPATARRAAAEILRLETALARASLGNVERRDPYAVKHKMAPTAFRAMAPAFDWERYFAALQAPPLAVANVTAPAFFTEASRRLRTESLALWKQYLRFHLADGLAPYLSQRFVAEDFDFHARYLRGAQELAPRWKRCVRLVDSQLGEALGQAYVRVAFKPETKAATLSMLKAIVAVMERRLQSREWMSPETRSAAITKLRAIRNKIGYPDVWRDYAAITLEPGNLAGNVRRAAAFEFARQLGKIGQPLDRGEWGMTAPTVNAYFDAQMNDINFPAGVLQPPLYDPKMDDAPNYGNTGGTIGHELTHGFDDEGRQYDAQGNLKDWWTKEDAARFAERARCISDQYGAYTAIDELKVKSDLTLGEDVADLGGEILAYEAWKEAVAGRELALRDGLTPDQRFFVGFAQWACENARPEQRRVWALTNPHSPARHRINGVVVNMPEFEKAFACKPGAAMTKPPGKACSIW
jgi:endothelin-converting enzyme/putative endopeptidase